MCSDTGITAEEYAEILGARNDNLLPILEVDFYHDGAPVYKIVGWKERETLGTDVEE